MCIVPKDSNCFCHSWEGKAIMRSADFSQVNIKNDINSTDSGSKNLLRQLLAGADPASVRSYSELRNSNFSLRRTASVSLSARLRPVRLNPDNAEELRPRRSTMFSHLRLHRRVPLDSRNEPGSPKRLKDSNFLETPLTVNVDYDDSFDCARTRGSDSSLGIFTQSTTANQELSLSTRCPCKIGKAMKEMPQILDLRTNTTKVDENVLDYSQKEQNSPSNSTDNNFTSLNATQTDVLQRLLQKVESPTEEAAISNPFLPQTWPIRLESKTCHILCKRVAEWLLAADIYATSCCNNLPPYSLLATSASSCAISSTQVNQIQTQNASKINVTSKLGQTLRVVLQRIWPQLLLVSMIRENFTFSFKVLTSSEIETLASESANVSHTDQQHSYCSDLPVAKLGTAHALLSLIEHGNQILLDTQIYECVRKCILSQYAYPTYFSVSFSCALQELRSCCEKSSVDISLFTSVLQLMMEMQSISPEGLHCLFSIDKLSTLFS